LPCAVTATSDGLHEKAKALTKINLKYS